MYNPKPVNTNDVVLPKSLLDLSEQIAKNVHDVWALNRLRDGWIYGEKRDDVAKTTPGLVSYENLSEREKDYDRNTALETIKLIIKLGFKIEK